MLLIAFIPVFCIPLVGYLVLRNKLIQPAYIGWFMAITSICGIHFSVKATALELMLLFITATFWSMKLVVAANHLNRNDQLNFVQWCVFCYGWFGMNPAPFKAFPGKRFPGYGSYILKGISRIVIGLAIITTINVVCEFVPAHGFVHIRYLFYLISLSLILHFGILNISTGCLRFFGVNVSALFKSPIKSKSLREFWSKRWNLAFVELTTLAVLRPLKKRFGDKIAFWASYVFSGLLHELAISLPVKSGYGKPFLFFILQAILIMGVEKHLIKAHIGKLVRLLWLMACLFLPVFILFHEQFILQIVVPLVNYVNILK